MKLLYKKKILVTELLKNYLAAMAIIVNNSLTKNKILWVAGTHKQKEITSSCKKKGFF